MRLFTAIMLLGVICVGAQLGGLGCRSIERDDPRSKAHSALWDVCIRVVLAEINTESDAPAKLPDLVHWLDKAGLCETVYMDCQRKTIIDIWGRDVVLLTQNGKLSGLGSKGEDGIWQGGYGDDITVMLDELRGRER